MYETDDEQAEEQRIQAAQERRKTKFWPARIAVTAPDPQAVKINGKAINVVPVAVLVKAFKSTKTPDELVEACRLEIARRVEHYQTKNITTLAKRQWLEESI